MPRAAAVVTLCVCVLSACGGGDDRSEPSRAQFTRRLMARNGLTHDQASCVTRYVFDENPPDVVEQLYQDGLTGVTMDRWNSFGHSMIACSLAGELGVDGRTAGSGNG